jgi:hypothetical protein
MGGVVAHLSFFKKIKACVLFYQQRKGLARENRIHRLDIIYKIFKCAHRVYKSILYLLIVMPGFWQLAVTSLSLAAVAAAAIATAATATAARPFPLIFRPGQGGTSHSR